MAAVILVRKSVGHRLSAALARLGERAALQWFRQGLTAEDPVQVQETVQIIAHEGLTLLWPDLDRLADCWKRWRLYNCHAWSAGTDGM